MPGWVFFAFSFTCKRTAGAVIFHDSRFLPPAFQGLPRAASGQSQPSVPAPTRPSVPAQTRPCSSRPRTLTTSSLRICCYSSFPRILSSWSLDSGDSLSEFKSWLKLLLNGGTLLSFSETQSSPHLHSKGSS